MNSDIDEQVRFGVRRFKVIEALGDNYRIPFSDSFIDSAVKDILHYASNRLNLLSPYGEKIAATLSGQAEKTMSNDTQTTTERGL